MNLTRGDGMRKKILAVVLVTSCVEMDMGEDREPGRELATAAAVDCSTAIPCEGRQRPRGAAALRALRGCSSIGGLRIDNTNFRELAGLECITSIDGSVMISGNPQLTSLRGFENLTSINGSLEIGGFSPGSNNPALSSLQGLENITSLRSLLIMGSPNLTSLHGLEKLAFVEGSMTISDSPGLKNLAELKNLTVVGDSLSIVRNSGMTSLTGLENVDAAATGYGALNIRDNPVLTSLRGLDNVHYVAWLDIRRNDSLTGLTGLESLRTVGAGITVIENANLTSLRGLHGLQFAGGVFDEGDLWIANNRVLSSLQGLDNLTTIHGDLRIHNNSVLASLAGIGNLTSIKGSLHIEDNSSLPACEVEMFAEQFSDKECRCSQNTGTGNCSPSATGHVLADFPACTNTALQSTLADACAAGDREVPVNPGTFADAAPPRIDVGRTYGVRLKAVDGQNEATLTFVVPTTNEYVIYLGTPNVPFQIDPLAPSCSRYLSPARVADITGGTCEKFRGAYRIPKSEAGTTVTIGMGPISPQSWVRLLILPK